MRIKASLPSSYPVRLASMRAFANTLSFWIYIHSMRITLLSWTIIHSTCDLWPAHYPPGSRPIHSAQCALIPCSSIQSALFLYFRMFSSWLKTHSVCAMCSHPELIHSVYVLCFYLEMILVQSVLCALLRGLLIQYAFLKINAL